MSERVSGAARVARGLLGVLVSGASRRGPFAGAETKALAELIQDDMDNDAVGIPTDSAAVVDHDGSRAAFRWENVPLAEVFEQAVEEATAAARL